LKKNLLGESPSDAPKNAAYLEHYVADMSVPYHLTGMPSEDAIKIYNDYVVLQEICRNNPEESPEKVKSNFTKAKGYWPEYLDVMRELDVKLEAPLQSTYNLIKQKTVLKPHVKLDSKIVGLASNASDTWEKALLSWRKDNNSDNDWFDPWFYNGVKWPTPLSTHIRWEFRSWGDSSNKLTGYAKDFNQLYGNGNEANIDGFAKKIADHTHQAALWDTGANKTDLLDHAITNVYTVWRASFSALRPTVTLQRDYKDCSIKLIVKIKNMEDDEPAKNILIHMSVQGLNLRGPATYEYSGEIPPKGEVVIPDIWTADNPEKGIRAEIALRVTGVFEKTPDSGEGRVKVDVEPIKDKSCLEGCQCLLEEEAQELFSKLGTKAVLGSSGTNWLAAGNQTFFNATHYEKCAEDPCGCDGSRPKYCCKPVCPDCKPVCPDCKPVSVRRLQVF
jgi:hypothetical protein